MTKSENTLIRLEAALERILAGEPKHIPKNRKLSIRAVEEEANLGNGSCHYYSEFSSKVRTLKNKQRSSNTQQEIDKEHTDSLRSRAANEKRIKEKYRAENEDLKRTIQQLAAEHHQFNELVRRHKAQSKQLERENKELSVALESTREELTQLKRERIIEFNKK
ncbi:hypothetical protein [Pseudoalteromonas ruthenica]|uniref:Uncharacterized protein n=1 Tax=Pseudoalteromonas ruthenica TaxID=151081 RepID=A0A0F4PSZ2_9GAMM|nr:hypothetical protein [Pseudoalteromonas ruthenica]KJY96666.1 hypothetical protein TW76_11435 [Pseudoalteromonas ruthenica]KJY98537.1 hypothetical protein TW72_12450 [Pseudoalteromonas ruthenica]TMO91259.1 hypothetical protein CWC13_15615 [Pseudoalteromonas ruthenica]TMO97946.1 hypothetical protein CWC07_12805 [Pseudoalteromonas ruthenica]TMP06839.1 hypothetical protein CWC09_10740 [Pseudoalteromonas ruthenica]